MEQGAFVGRRVPDASTDLVRYGAVGFGAMVGAVPSNGVERAGEGRDVGGMITKYSPSQGSNCIASWLIKIVLLASLVSGWALGQAPSALIKPVWTVPVESSLGMNDPSLFGQDGSALLRQSSTNWIWVRSDGQRATLTDVLPVMGGYISHLSSQTLILLTADGSGPMSTNTICKIYQRAPDGLVNSTTVVLPGRVVDGLTTHTITIPGYAAPAVSNRPPNGWLAMRTEAGFMGPEPRSEITLYRLDPALLGSPVGNPPVSIQSGDPVQIRVEAHPSGPVVIRASEDLKTWTPWATLWEPGTATVLPVSNQGHRRRFFSVEQVGGVPGGDTSR